MALVPSAPPLHVDLRAVLEGSGDLMSLEPPKWVPDSSSPDCTACARPFSFLLRSRHHCRVCGDLFCDACSSGEAAERQSRGVGVWGSTVGGFCTGSVVWMCLGLCKGLEDREQVHVVGVGAERKQRRHG